MALMYYKVAIYLIPMQGFIQVAGIAPKIMLARFKLSLVGHERAMRIHEGDGTCSREAIRHE
jgi:hypothetical protein